MMIPARRALVALTLAVAACAGGSSGPATSFGSTTTIDPGPTIPIATPTTAVVTIPLPTAPIVVWVETTEIAAAVAERATAYTVTSGVPVEVRVYEPPTTPLPEGETATDLLSALLLDQVEGQADLYLGEHTWALALAEAGRAEPVFLASGLPESLVAAVSPRGYPLGIPLAVDAVAQVRNRALMPEAPAAVETIPCPEDDRCLVLPADGDADVHYPFLVALGGYLFGADPDGGLDTDDLGVSSDEAIAGATILDGLVGDGTVTTEPDEGSVVSAFAEGGVALAWIHASSLAAARQGGMDIAVEALPTIGDAPAIGAFRALTAFIDPFGEAKSEALTFATDWLGDLNGSASMALAWGGAPVWVDAAAADLAVFVEAATGGQALPAIPGIDRIWFEVSDAFRRIYLDTTPGNAMFGAADDIRLVLRSE